MREAFVNKSFNYINNHKTLNNYQQLKIKYGLEVMYHFVTKYTVIILLSIILNLYRELLFITIFYIPLRMFGHGVHSKSNLMCWISSIVSLLGLSYLSKEMFINSFIIEIAFTLGIISFFLWSPSDTPKRPLISRSKRLNLKRNILLITLLYLVICLYIKDISAYMIIAICIQIYNVNPFIYLINKVPRNNYVGIERS